MRRLLLKTEVFPLFPTPLSVSTGFYPILARTGSYCLKDLPMNRTDTRPRSSSPHRHHQLPIITPGSNVNSVVSLAPHATVIMPNNALGFFSGGPTSVEAVLSSESTSRCLGTDQHLGLRNFSKCYNFQQQPVCSAILRISRRRYILYAAGFYNRHSEPTPETDRKSGHVL